MDWQALEHQMAIGRALAEHEWHTVDISQPIVLQELRSLHVLKRTEQRLQHLNFKSPPRHTEQQLQKVVELLKTFIKQGVSSLELSTILVTECSDGDASFRDIVIFKIRPNSDDTQIRFVSCNGQEHEDWQNAWSSSQTPGNKIFVPLNGTYSSNVFYSPSVQPGWNIIGVAGWTLNVFVKCVKVSSKVLFTCLIVIPFWLAVMLLKFLLKSSVKLVKYSYSKLYDLVVRMCSMARNLAERSWESFDDFLSSFASLMLSLFPTSVSQA